MSESGVHTTSVLAIGVLGDPPVTAGAMRAAADLITASGITGLSVTCDDHQISIQVPARAGDDATRAAIVAHLAELLGGVPARQDDQGGAGWIHAHGVAGALPVHVYTPWNNPGDLRPGPAREVA